MQAQNKVTPGINDSPREIAVFDIDGTIVDSLPFAYKGICGACEKFSFKQPLLEEIRMVYDPSDRFRNFYRALGVPEEMLDDFSSTVHKIISKDMRSNKPDLIPTAAQILRIMKNKGIDLKILTLAKHERTIYKLGESLYKEVFTEFIPSEGNKIIALGKVKQCYPHSSVTYVGDAVSDGEAALAAGVRFIGLATPYSYSQESKIIEFARKNIEKARYATSHFHMLSVYDSFVNSAE